MTEKLAELGKLFAQLRDKDTKFTSSLLRQHDANYASTNARCRPEMDDAETRVAREEYHDVTKQIMKALEG